MILDKSDYRTKVNDILSDRSKFSIVTQPLHKVSLQVEDKVNRVLNKLKKSATITTEVYSDLYVSGSTPGILYGLPKIHKLLVPLRPIFAACGTPTYKLAKYLVPFLLPLTKNQFTVKNSYEFVNDLQSVKINSNAVFASFDIESLFTNMTVRKTLDICIRSLFTNIETIAGITKRLFCTLLELAVLNSYFLFDVLYKQEDGVGMGLPLGPTFANIFLCFQEEKWLDDCPSEYRPKYFRRYTDDCFLIFDDRSQIDKFLDYLNGRHPKIRFTK